MADALQAHLTARYGIQIRKMARLDAEVFRVDGPSWVARRFPIGTEDAVRTTAAVLRRLEETPFPAERLAHPEPISLCEDRPVLITEFVAGTRAPGTPRMFAALGGLLGALNARTGRSLPAGGGWHHLVAQGTPSDEIAAARALLQESTGDPAARQTLDEELARLDDGADLPHGIVHPDFVPANLVRVPGHGVVVVDWAGCGRGPRLWSLGFLLWAAGARSLDLVDAVLSRYQDHVTLTTEELDRLPGVIHARPLVLDCWSVGHGRLDWSAAIERLDRRERLATRIGEHARRVLTG